MSDERQAVEALFAKAAAVISALPTRRSSNSAYDIVDCGSEENSAAWKCAGDVLLGMADAAPPEKAFYFSIWAADVFVGSGDLRRALRVQPAPVVGGRSSSQTDRRLSIKSAIGEPVDGADIVTLFGPKLTSYGRRNIEDVVRFLDIQVGQLQRREGRDFLTEWARDAHVHAAGFSLFNGHQSYIFAPHPPGFIFSLSPSADAACVELMRDAENTLREERDLPKIGEGWIAETELFYAIKSALPGVLVQHHGRPVWLGNQHLDIYLPDLKVAVEYHGTQHDMPVAFFGGEAAYLKNVERDRRKAARCRANGIRLIYVREGYQFSSVLAQIVSLL